jgi:hypothetical protein
LIRGVGRHSRKGPAPEGPQGPWRFTEVAAGDSGPDGTGVWQGEREYPGRDSAEDPGQDAGPGYGTPAHGTPQVRGGHPEQRESGGGWGSAQRYGDWQGTATRGAGTGTADGPRPPRPPGAGLPLIPKPRREFIDAFDAFDALDTPPTPVAQPVPSAPVAGTMPWGPAPDLYPAATPSSAGRDGADGAGSGGPAGGPDTEEPDRNGRGRAFTGIAAAAVTTVLAVVVAGQVADGGNDKAGTQAADGVDRGGQADGTGGVRSDGGTGPSWGADSPSAPATYAQLMDRQFPMDPKLRATGRFVAAPGFAKAPGKGQKFRYRVDVEDGLNLDGTLFADAVQKTLNDKRSWAHNGAMTFERISSGEPDFVITLASPGTTAFWCAKSGLDTTVDNVSCDSAATDRVMINAFRWAQGADTFGPDAMLSYRQMLINHEVGHRLGYSHVRCRTPGALAPVMQQQTKTLDIDGVKCKPNPWVYPTG